MVVGSSGEGAAPRESWRSRTGARELRMTFFIVEKYAGDKQGLRTVF
jgi:hypothetical protein